MFQEWQNTHYLFVTHGNRRLIWTFSESERKYTRDSAERFARRLAAVRDKWDGLKGFWHSAVFADDSELDGSLYWRVNIGGQHENNQ
jgi:NAD(P)H-flavin reductase